ncbi:1409_t:CDS:2, partial [Gigaspora rosea]
MIQQVHDGIPQQVSFDTCRIINQVESILVFKHICTNCGAKLKIKAPNNKSYMIGYFQCLCGTKINIANNLLTSTENISIPYIAPVNYSKISDGDMALIQLNPFQVNNYFPIPPPELAYQNTEYHESCQQLPALEIQNEETERQVFPTISNISNEIQSVVSQDKCLVACVEGAEIMQNAFLCLNSSVLIVQPNIKWK